MTNTLYASCAEVLSLAQSRKDDLAALVDPETGFAPKLRQICYERLEELQDNPGAGSEMEMLALKMESDTWGLLQAVMPLRKMAPPTFPSPQFLIATNPYTPPATLAQAIMHASPLLTELIVVREWLHETAPLDPGPGAATGYWKFTKYQLLQNARMGKGKQKAVALVSEMDPDAGTREDSALASDDTSYDKALVQALYACVRAGRLDEAVELCRKAHQPWRAASLRGSFLFQWKAISNEPRDDDFMDDGDMDGWQGNLRRKLWKATCIRSALNPSLPPGERALYAALAPCPQTSPALKSACKTWEDHLWAQISIMCEEKEVSEMARLKGGHWLQYEDRLGDAAEDETMDEDLEGPENGNEEEEWEREVANTLASLGTIQVDEGAPADNPYHISQLQIILGNTDELLREFANGLREGSYDRDAPEFPIMTRFFAHLCLFLQIIEIPTPAVETQVILEVYLGVLEAAGQRDLIAMYAGALGDNAVLRYAMFLTSLDVSTDINERRLALTRAREHGLDMERVAVATAERTIEKAFAALPTPKGSLPTIPSLQPPANAVESLLIRSIEWTSFLSSTHPTLLEQANVIVRFFLAHGRVQLARQTLDLLPRELASIREPEERATEYVQYRVWARCWDGLDRIAEVEKMNAGNVASMGRDTFAEWVQDYKTLLEQTREQVVKLLTTEWLVSESTEGGDRRRRDLVRIRQIFIPEFILRLHGALYRSRHHIPENLKQCLALTNTVADSRYKLYDDFVGQEGHRLGDYLQAPPIFTGLDNTVWMSFFSKLEEDLAKVGNRAAEGLHHARETAIGILNPNRRHDTPEEKADDQVRAEINASHRFESFASERSQNAVKWHVDGHDYMYALSEMLENAREAIFILDWWLTPELYLRRPPAANPEWRLDRILKRKAEQGVKVYVVVYKEVTQTMSMSSKHTKFVLDGLHANVACMRHPDHIGSKDDVAFWSHHEKVVVVDNHRACIGGLDLCFGRWDTNTHPLADVHPTDFSRTLFPGQDYNNARVLDFQEVSQYLNTGLSLTDTPRMPWHDVHMTLCGPVVLDIVQHFVERWNEIKKRKYRNDLKYDWLALPHDINAAPNEAVVRHPHLYQWMEQGRRFKERFHRSQNVRFPEEDEDPETYKRPPHGTCNVQVVRSVSDWSHGVLTEKSVQTAYCQLIREAKHYIYIENQFFISATNDKSPIKNQIAKALVERIILASENDDKFRVVVVLPEVPGFAGNVKDESSVKIIMAAQYRTINRGGSSIYEELRKVNIEPTDYIRFYHLRAYDRINAPYNSFIKQMEDYSGVKFQEAQVALARQWVGKLDGPDTPQDVTVVYPSDAAYNDKAVLQGSSEKKENKVEPKKETFKLPATEDEARDVIVQFESGARNLRSDEPVSDNVVQHMLNDRTSLLEEKWLGTDDEEKYAYVSELLYIHSKVMIVDDRKVIMGSANINDRSQKGDGDSEICLVVEDQDFIESHMNGEPYWASRFASTLRRRLYREHLGLIPPQLCYDNEPVTSFMRPSPIQNEDETHSREDRLVADPLSDQTISLWNATAKKNREVFTEIFRPVPTNLVRSWSQYDNYMSKAATDHVVPEADLKRIKQRLSEVKGAVVEAPLDFLIDDKEFVTGPEWSELNPTLPIYI
ncbi:hypothetical protein EUX98_g6279 [Antrodiella citrinella]|uniref:phospholipase D n=1 Tax=Antrodiella citrinella TaxID=2447956 RepID=A0A4S4MS20_9APHY|nr:hypothetical protein EUX98_g6279 [Antrodiella citrinella]